MTHLQEAFLSPATAKSGAAAVQNGAHADSSSEDDSEDEDEEADEASPEDAGRRRVPLIYFHFSILLPALSCSLQSDKNSGLLSALGMLVSD